MYKSRILKSWLFFLFLWIMISYNYNLVHAVTLTSIINPESTTTTVNYQETHPTQFSYPAIAILLYFLNNFLTGYRLMHRLWM
jgi:hypothetical protein